MNHVGLNQSGDIATEIDCRNRLTCSPLQLLCLTLRIVEIMRMISIPFRDLSEQATIFLCTCSMIEKLIIDPTKNNMYRGRPVAAAKKATANTNQEPPRELPICAQRLMGRSESTLRNLLLPILRHRIDELEFEFYAPNLSRNKCRIQSMLWQTRRNEKS